MAPVDKKRGNQPDWWLLTATLLLISIGIIMVFSASQYTAQYAPYNDAYYFLKLQLRNAGIGLVMMFVAYRVNYQLYYKLSYPVFAVVAILLVFMVVSNQIETIGGAQRWIELFGVTFQPSELAKIAMPMAMAAYATRNIKNMKSFKRGFLPSMLFLGITAALIYLQEDLSSALVVAAAGMIIIFCAGVNVWHLAGLGGIAVLGVVASIFTGWRMDRIYAWLDPWAYSSGDGWQTVQSLMAIGSGGFTGVGLGSGGSKWFYLPARHTDFIFSILCEELGFLGALFVLALLLFIIWRGILIAVKAPDTFSSLLVIGMISSLGVQSIINLFVCTGLFPVTGITLPFVSYGGTSLIVSMTMIGMMMNISRCSRN